MAHKLLTKWSPEYIDALFKTDRAYWARMGIFPSCELLAVFLDSMTAPKFEGIGVEPLADGRGVRITNAGARLLLDIVALAMDCGGEILFPGTLPA